MTICTTSRGDNLQGYYLGFSSSHQESDISSVDGGTVGFSVAELMFGYKYRWYAGAELRLGKGFTSDDNVVRQSLDDGTEADISIESSITAYQSLYYRIETVNQVAKLYVLLGYTNIEVETTSILETITRSDSGLSYAAGIGFVTGSHTNLGFEYKQLLDTNTNGFSGFTVTWDYRF